MQKAFHLMTLALLAMTLSLISACPGPDYPKCEKDDHCAKDAEGKEIAEVCVFGQCQECGSDEHCSDGKSCRNYRCESVCAEDGDCGDGLSCFGGECKSECDAVAGGCDDSQNCQKGRCVAAAAPCEEDGDCDIGFRCSTGICTEGLVEATQATEACGEHVRVFFDYNEIVLNSDSRTTLEQLAECLQGHPDWNLTVEGHADERGTTEYNLALGEKRARTVIDYLKNLGVPMARFAPFLTVKSVRLNWTATSNLGQKTDEAS